MINDVEQLDDNLGFHEGSLEDVCCALDEIFDVEKGTAMQTVFPRMMRTMIDCRVDPNAVWYVKKVSDTTAHLLRRASVPSANNQIYRSGWVVTIHPVKVFDKEDMIASGVKSTDDPSVAQYFLREKMMFAVSSSRYGVVTQYYPRRKLQE